MWAYRKSHGFTIVELLIVVVIIGILAAIVVVAYNGLTQRANASSISSFLASAEKGFRLYVSEQGYSTWPLETTLTSGGAGNPRITDIISYTTLSNYLQQVPSSPIASTNWRFDSDGDTYGGCSTGGQGVNILITNMTDTALAQAVDDSIDDGNLSCGKVRHDGSATFLYAISNGPAL